MMQFSITRLRDCIERYQSSIPELADVADQLQALAPVDASAAGASGLDALVFTAGVGENSPYVRSQACVGLEKLGIVLDPEANEGGEPGTIRQIQHKDSAVKVLVVPTNEELEIARQTSAVVSQTA